MDRPNAVLPLRRGPRVSVVIPVYNEESVLPELFTRLYPALDAMGRTYECIFVDDGSRDRSVALLRAQYSVRPLETRIIVLQTNFGQHAAILAAFEQSRGEVVVTLDADLQNPPEEIARLLAAIDAGHDYVGTIRRERRDSWLRKWPSRFVNAVRQRTTRIDITDHGSMLRAYSRNIVDAVNASREVITYIPALGYLYARSPTEIEVAHEARFAGQSKYSMYKLIRLNFDLMTGFSLAPLRFFSMLGMIVASLSAMLFVLLAVRRLIIGPEAEGLFTLFAIAFFLIGLGLFGIGLIGEYVGRIYEQVRVRPRYLIASILESEPAAEREKSRV